MRKHKPPAQIRYEKKHPVVSFRLEREIKERLENVLEGKSFADFVKEGLGVREREKKSLEKTRGEGYAEGHDKGFTEGHREGSAEGYDEGYIKAKRIFGVHTACAFCGEYIIFEGEGKKELEESLRERKWYHGECLDRVEIERRDREEYKREIKREIESFIKKREKRKKRKKNLKKQKKLPHPLELYPF